MKVVVLGANGATGYLVVSQLLKNGVFVKALTRNEEKFTALEQNNNLEVVKCSILEIEENLLKDLLSDVHAVISCLGHNISLKGIFGKPRKLVTDALARIISSIDKERNTKVILMNTTACLNKMQNENFKGGDKIVMNIMRFILPPQRDNDAALDYLIDTVGKNKKHIEWIAVRPDTLIDADEVSEYSAHPSTLRSPISDAGKTSRINVAAFMVDLLQSDELWDTWKFKTPVLYNSESVKSIEKQS